MTDTADVVVIGLGAIGSATLHRLAKRGVKAIGIDRFHPPHDRGSTHGESRITRMGVGEGAAYAAMVRRSHEIWRELETESGEALFLETGGLILGPMDGGASHHGQRDFVRRSIAVAEANGIAHEVLDSGEIGRRYPQLDLRGNEIGYFEPTAGLVLPERCVAVQLALATALGAVVRTGETVLSVTEIPGGVAVVTDKGQLEAARVVMAAGPWIPGLAGQAVAARTEVYRQTLHWFPAADPAAYAPARFPIFIWIHGQSAEDYFYGFPILPGGAGVKVASERYAAPVDPDQSERTVSAAESAEMFERHVAGRLRGVGAAVQRAAACLYTVTPDSGFLVDLRPGTSRVVVASACSGHGFKHSAGLGEIVAAFAAGDGPLPAVLTPFAMGRFE